MENIIKNAEIEISSGEPDEKALTLISQYTKSKPDKDSIYIFGVKLCDNEVDRDFEAFSADALKSLEALMKGRTGILDHNPKADNQVARIYDCKLITEDRKTTAGEKYTYLAGFAYMPRTAATEDFIASIEAGIHKETSIGCAAKHRICSICGKDARVCGHRKGETYEGKLCYTVLDGITDAYEWSFVAVPAQREAGVMKQFKPASEVIKSVIDKSLDADAQTEGITISIEEAKILSEEITRLTLEKQAYKEELEKEVIRLACIANSHVSNKSMTVIVQKMEYEELKELKKELERACIKTASPQIISQRQSAEAEDCRYKI